MEARWHPIPIFAALVDPPHSTASHFAFGAPKMAVARWMRFRRMLLVGGLLERLRRIAANERGGTHGLRLAVDRCARGHPPHENQRDGVLLVPSAGAALTWRAVPTGHPSLTGAEFRAAEGLRWR